MMMIILQTSSDSRQVQSAECIFEEEEQDPIGRLKVGDIHISANKLGDDPIQTPDILKEINLGTETDK